MIVVLAEKPSVAMDLARVLGAGRRRDGYMEGAGYQITWALGHLVQLAEPQDIHPKWRSWRVLPILPDHFPLVPRVGDAQRLQLERIARLFRSRSTSGIVNAADAGREGELIFRYICEYVFDGERCDKPIKRFWASSLTDDAIRAAFAQLKPQSAYDRLAEAARLRSRLDWLVGMNGTRALASFGGQARAGGTREPCLTVGRVQTPTLAMIAARDERIRTHVPAAYCEVMATFVRVADGAPVSDCSVPATYERLTEDEKGAPKWDARLWPPAVDGIEVAPSESPELVRARALVGVASVKGVQRESRLYRPQQLFDLTSLQRTMNVVLGWTAAKTLAVAQELYEKHKLLSYPRTDSRYLSATVAAELSAVVDAIRDCYDCHLVESTGRAALGRRYVDDSKVSDHHAIIPTSRSAAELPPASDAAKLYDVVCRRLLGAWQPDSVEAVTELVFEILSEGFSDRYVARGVEVVVTGWRSLEPKSHNDGQTSLPPGWKAGAPAHVCSVELLAKSTRAPKAFSEATLLSAMEGAGASLEGAAAEAMRERGLGTPATRAAVIENLIQRGYVERDGKALHATERGCRLVATVHDGLKSAELTGDMEARLKRVERGSESPEAFMESATGFVRRLVEAHRGGLPA